MNRQWRARLRRDAARRSRALHCLLFVLLIAAPCAAAPVLLRPQYRLDATVRPEQPQIEGRVEIAFTNLSRRPLEEAVLLLFANRFSEPDTDLNDFTRTLVYPRQVFDPGGMEILDVSDGGAPSSAAPLPVTGLPPATFVRVPIAPLAPGATRTLSIGFRTTAPHRYGTFGAVDGQLTLLGGWYPMLAALDEAGFWAIDVPPPLGDCDVTLRAEADLTLLLNGRAAPPGAGLARARVPGVHYLTLIAAPRLLVDETRAGETRIVYLHAPAPVSSQRLALGPSRTELVLASLAEIVARRPAPVPAPPEVVVVAAPLRQDLTAPGEGAVVVSDRLLELPGLLRPFHELQLAQAVYAELLRRRLAPREPARDYPWVSEGVSRLLAERYLMAVQPERRDVYQWIDLFNVFATVDRFEVTPKIPFTGAFFAGAREADPRHVEVGGVTAVGPPGRVTMAKLRALLGPPAFDPLLDACLNDPAPFAACVAAGAPDHPIAARLAEWTGPYPAIDYRVESTEFNVPDGAGGYRHRVGMRRVASRPFVEPVTVRLQSLGGADVDVQWRGEDGDVGIVSTTTDGHVYRAVIDPDRALIDDDRGNNAWLPRTQVVVDSADVEVTSSEFGIAALLVGRLRYDYTKDLAVSGFYTNRGVGFTAGPRLHWGTPIDGARFRNNLYAFYRFEALDRSFVAVDVPRRRTGGQLGGFGARYDYGNVYWGDWPTRQRRLRLFVDWYETELGSNYDYVDWGYVASATTPLFTPRTVLAGEILNGFSEPYAGSLVPNQGLYGLGGERSIRGISAEQTLARNIFVLRTELRRELTSGLDLDLLDAVVLRDINVRLLLDTGQVSNSAGRIYDVGRWAVGAGVGVGLRYDVMGFFPASAYLDIATRLDEDQGDVQVLFGSSQSF